MNTRPDTPNPFMARLSGFAYVAYVSLGLYISFGPVAGAWDTTAGAMTAGDEFKLRTGFVAETLLYLFVVISTAAMYATLRNIGRGIAFTAALCRLMEGAMGATFVLVKYAAFAVLLRDDLVGAFPGGEREALAALLKHAHGSGLYFLLIVMGAGGTLFFLLFFRARFIPRWLAAWGIATYTSMAFAAILVILFPSVKPWVMIAFLPGAAFEALVGLWLLFAGIDTRHLRNREARDHSQESIGGL